MNNAPIRSGGTQIRAQLHVQVTEACSCRMTMHNKTNGMT